MKIALLGKNGQVGCELQKLLASHGELLTLSREEPGGDLTDVPAMIGRLEAFSPLFLTPPLIRPLTGRKRKKKRPIRLMRTR